MLRGLQAGKVMQPRALIMRCNCAMRCGASFSSGCPALMRSLRCRFACPLLRTVTLLAARCSACCAGARIAVCHPKMQLLHHILLSSAQGRQLQGASRLGLDGDGSQMEQRIARTERALLEQHVRRCLVDGAPAAMASWAHEHSRLPVSMVGGTQVISSNWTIHLPHVWQRLTFFITLGVPFLTQSQCALQELKAVTCNSSRLHLQRPPLSLKSLLYVPLLCRLCSWVMSG